MSASSEGGRSFARRDQLLKIQAEAQKLWEKERVFEAESKPSRPSHGEKFFGNFPNPYMNGSLHLGHAFSLSELEFAAAYHRLRGRNVLLPFAFHCTGMPIKASADKLDREISQFGNPPPLEKAESGTLDPDRTCGKGHRSSLLLRTRAGGSICLVCFSLLEPPAASPPSLTGFGSGSAGSSPQPDPPPRRPPRPDAR